MTCIDSAIIRALVEHIGMNPDEVPIGGSGGGSSAASTSFELEKEPGYCPMEPTLDGNDYTEGYEHLYINGIHPGTTVLKLKRKDNGELEDWLCCSSRIEDTFYLVYEFLNLANPDANNTLKIRCHYEADQTEYVMIRFVDFAKTYEQPSPTRADDDRGFYRLKITSLTNVWSFISAVMYYQSKSTYQLWYHTAHLFSKLKYEALTDAN